MQPIVELATCKIQDTITQEKIAKAVEETRGFLRTQEGFVSRELCRMDDGSWHDILLWESHGYPMAAMLDALDTPDSQHRFALYSLLDAKNDAVLLFSSLRAVSLGDLMRVSSMLSCKSRQWQLF